MEAPKCYVLVRALAPKGDKGKMWVYDMPRIPEVGERIDGEELSNPGTSWRCRLVIKDPTTVAMLAAFDAIDEVANQGDVFAVTFCKLLSAIAEGKRVI